MKLLNNKLLTSLSLMLSAASALVYEIAATKILFFYFIETSYSISTVLSVFLFGLGIGSFIVYKFFIKSEQKQLLFGLFQIIIALYAVVILTNLRSIIPTLTSLGTLAVSVVILIIPAIFFGAVFPLAASLLSDKKRDTTGLTYSIDLAGAIGGSLLAGFIIIPNFGVQTSIIIGSFLNLLSAFLILPKRKKLIPLGTFIIIEFFLLNNIQVLKSNAPQKGSIEFIKNSPFGEVRLQDKTLYINNMEQCSVNYAKDTSERKMAEYAINPLKDKHPSLEILNIGLGCGLTIENILQYNNTKVDVVEINPVVVEANKLISSVTENPRVKLTVDDGMKYLMRETKKYHAILIDIEDPRVSHSLPLYTVEAFAQSERMLESDGVLALWNYEDMSPSVKHSDRYFDILYYSLKQSFPFVYQYPGVFIASKVKLERPEYVPSTKEELNTLDKNTLTEAAFESGVLK